VTSLEKATNSGGCTQLILRDPINLEPQSMGYISSNGLLYLTLQLVAA